MICHKVRGLSISGKIEEWLRDFLKYRRQAVVANVATLTEIHTTVVVLSTVLGLLLSNVAFSAMLLR